MSFYRTYRPQIIEEIDNIRVRDALLALLTKPKKDLPHAYLFCGPRGGGKTTAARILAKLFNCEKPSKSGPCGTCEQCVSIEAGRNLDVMELDAASNRGIDEIRTLRDGIALAPVSASHKIYIIDEVHMLTTEAFNALLKTLEEPPTHAIFVLATTDPQKVPVTITSRCQVLSFAKATPEELISALKRIVKKEHIEIEDAAMQLIVQSVDGSFRDGVKYLEQASFQKETITQKNIQTLFSLSTSASVTEFSDALVLKNIDACLAMVQKLVDTGADIKVFLVQVLENLHKKLLADIKNSDLDVAIRKLSVAYTELKTTAIPQLPLELAVIEYCGDNNKNISDVRNTKPEIRKETPKPEEQPVQAIGELSLEKLVEHWTDVIAELKPYNHSVAGVMRSTRPASVKDGIVTIEAFYTFHKDKLSENKTREVIADVLKKLFGEKVKVEIVLGKK